MLINGLSGNELHEFTKVLPPLNLATYYPRKETKYD